MEINEEKRKKFMEYAGKRVNNVLHGIQILEPMSRSNAYDYTKQDVDEMFSAMQESLNNAKAEFDKKFDEKARMEKKTFTFGSHTLADEVTTCPTNDTNCCDTSAADVNTACQTATATSDESPISSNTTTDSTYDHATDTNVF